MLTGAAQGCVSRGGDLVSVSGEDEQAEVMALMGAGPECPEGFSLVEDTCYLQVSCHWSRPGHVPSCDWWRAGHVTRAAAGEGHEAVLG